jgi:hypothetical protein
MIMNLLVLEVVQPHQAYSGNVYGDHRGACQKTPQEIVSGPFVAHQLADGYPTQECERDIRKGRAIRQDYKNSGAIRKSD